MHLPDIFTENNPDILKDFIKAYPLGTLISIHDNVPQADLLPFYLTEEDNQITLIAHFAKDNPLADYVHESEVMILFYGKQGYISPNWYPTKQVHHRHVPTYNYEVVQVRGRVRIFDDIKNLMRALGTLTNIHESTQHKPWKLKDAPRDYLEENLQEVLGLSVEVTDMIGKFKLSQNREQQDFDNVVQALKDNGQSALADAIAKTRKQT